MFDKKSSDGYPNIRYAWFALVTLLLVYTCSFLDRQILSLLVDPVKDDLGISDTKLSLLQGLSFALFYSILLVATPWQAGQAQRPLTSMPRHAS